MTPRRRSGFVLLEAVVALAILGVASIVLLQVRAQQIRVATQAHELLTAQALAEDRISTIRMLDYFLLDDPPDSLMTGVFPPPFEEFSWNATIALMEDEYDLFGVEVEVLGPYERFPLRTLIHRPRPVLAGGGIGAGGAAQGSRAGDRTGDRAGDQAGRGGGRAGDQAGRGGDQTGRGGTQGGRGGGQTRPGGGAGGNPRGGGGSPGGGG